MHTRTVLAAASMTALTAAFAAAALMQLGGFGATEPDTATPTIVTAPSTPAGSTPGETSPLTVPPPTPAANVGAPTAASPASAGGSGRSPTTTLQDDGSDGDGSDGASVTTVGTTQVATTQVATTTSTAPARITVSGQAIPANWQLSSSWLASGKPIPSYPSSCQKGQLEDNGRWNCE